MKIQYSIKNTIELNIMLKRINLTSWFIRLDSVKKMKRAIYVFISHVRIYTYIWINLHTWPRSADCSLIISICVFYCFIFIGQLISINILAEEQSTKNNHHTKHLVPYTYFYNADTNHVLLGNNVSNWFSLMSVQNHATKQQKHVRSSELVTSTSAWRPPVPHSSCPPPPD